MRNNGGLKFKETILPLIKLETWQIKYVIIKYHCCSIHKAQQTIKIDEAEKNDLLIENINNTDSINTTMIKD